MAVPFGGEIDAPKWVSPSPDLKTLDGATVMAGRSFEHRIHLSGQMFCAEYSSTPDLPKGLAFDEDGQFKGIPLELSCAKVYKIVARGVGFECSDEIKFKVVEPEGGSARTC